MCWDVRVLLLRLCALVASLFEDGCIESCTWHLAHFLQWGADRCNAVCMCPYTVRVCACVVFSQMTPG
mgnify:CR=1 FL=1